MSMFHVGQQVVCAWPCGCVYTIRAIAYERTYLGGLPALGIWVEEISNPIHAATGVEFGFTADRFRPVKDTSIEVFRAFLSPIHERENA